ncbi:MAG: hypothetical protein KKA76_13795, partial [Proteobacteria bacterium]|nr:hypothetical protein [Pseudomonadota bacterium]
RPNITGPRSKRTFDNKYSSRYKTERFILEKILLSTSYRQKTAFFLSVTTRFTLNHQHRLQLQHY